MFALNIPTSSNIADLLAKKAELEALAKKNQEDLNADRPIFIVQVRELIRTFGITKVEAFPPLKDQQATVDKDYSPDYFFRDLTTGEEWNGKGKRPAYLSGKKKTDKFRIYHATGTRFAPVVKPASDQRNSTSAVGAPNAPAMPLEPVVGSSASVQSPSDTSAISYQPTAASTPSTAEHSASAVNAGASAEVVAVTS